MKRSQALPFVLLLGFLYGSTLVVSRFSVGQYDPRVYISLRIFLAAMAHLAVYRFGARIGQVHPWPQDACLWRRAAILGILGTAVPMTSIVSSLQYQSSGVTSLLLTLNPAVTVVLAQLFLDDERMTVTKVSGVLIAMAGAGLLLLRGETGLADLAVADWRGYAWAAFGVLASGSANVYARRYLRNNDSWDVASIRMLAAAAFLLPVTWLTVGFDLSGVDRVGYAALIYAAFVGTFSGMWLSFYIIKRFGATSASQTSYVIPVVTTVLGALILGEHVTPGMLVGMVVIFTGIALLNSRRGLTSTGKSALSTGSGD